MEGSIKEEEKVVERVVDGKKTIKALSPKVQRQVDMLAKKDIDAFAIGKFRVLNQAILVRGLKCYPASKGMDRNKKAMDLEADIVAIQNLEAKGIGVKGEVDEGLDYFLERVGEKTELQSRVKDHAKRVKKAKKGSK